jgi:hypothetical protein
MGSMMSDDCALFVDHEDLWLNLLEQDRTVSDELTPGDLAQGLWQAAERFGRVQFAWATADWDQTELHGHARAYRATGFDVHYRDMDRSRADAELAQQVEGLLTQMSDGAPGTVVLATSDGAYFSLIENLLERGKRVVLWGIEGVTSRFLWSHPRVEKQFLRDVVPVFSASPLEADAETEIVPDAAAEPIGTPEADASQPDEITVPEPAVTVPEIEVLTYRVNRLLAQRHWTFVTYNQLINYLAEEPRLGEALAERGDWFTAAQEAGCFLAEQAIAPDGNEILQYRLNGDNVHVRRVKAVLEAIMTLAGPTLTSAYQPDQATVQRQLAEAVDGLDEARAEAWLTYALEVDWLVASVGSDEHVRGPSASGVALNPDDPLVRAEREQRPLAEILAELILEADRLLTERSIPWVAASILLRALASRSVQHGVSEAEAWRGARRALSEARERGIVEIRKDDSPSMGELPRASEVYLARDVPPVRETLKARDILLRELHDRMGTQPWVLRTTFLREVGELVPQGELEASLWVDLLVRIELLNQDARPHPERDDEPASSLTLNLRSPAVRELLGFNPRTDAREASDAGDRMERTSTHLAQGEYAEENSRRIFGLRLPSFRRSPTNET